MSAGPGGPARGRRLVALYTLFAVLATLVNLGAQRAVLALGESAPFFAAAVVLGTGLGLVVKYLLDKRWIFADREGGARAHGRKFTLYTVMGLATTAIFWGAETLAWVVWGSDLARETGAVLGLALGYAVKYQLDRRFVFSAPKER